MQFVRSSTEGPFYAGQDEVHANHTAQYLPDPYPAFRRLVLILSIYFIPVIISLGVIGNIFSLMVFLGTHMRRRSFSVYLASIAIADTGFLLSLSLTWLEYVNVNVFHSRGWCQLAIYLSYVSSFLSVWFVVSFTVERYIAVCHPLKRPAMCTAERAWNVVFGLSLLAAAAYSVTLWTSGIAEVDGILGDTYYVCTPLKKYMAVHNALTYVDSVHTLLVPFVTIIVLNSRIAIRVTYFYQRHKKTQQESHLDVPLTVREARGRPTLCSKAQLQVTKMLLISSSLFLLINTPSYVLRVRNQVLAVLNCQESVHDQQFQMLLQQIFQLIYYSNFALNFVVYSICSSKFRQAFIRFWRQMHRRVTSECRVRHWRSSCCPRAKFGSDFQLRNAMNPTAYDMHNRRFFELNL